MGDSRKEINTIVGVFTVNAYDVPSQYRLSEKSEVLQDSDGKLRLTTIDQSVIIDGQKYGPKVYQNCMNPTDIVIYPLKIIQHRGQIRFADHYNSTEWITDCQSVEIQNWYPTLQKNNCMPCHNCGRC